MFAVFGQEINVLDLMAQMTQVESDVVLLEAHFDHHSTRHLLDEVLAKNPNSRVLVLAWSGETLDIISAIEAGAAGYMTSIALSPNL